MKLSAKELRAHRARLSEMDAEARKLDEMIEHTRKHAEQFDDEHERALYEKEAGLLQMQRDRFDMNMARAKHEFGGGE